MSENDNNPQLSAAGTNLPLEPSKTDDAAAGSSMNVTEPSGGKAEAKDEKSQETRKMGSFPSDLSTIKPIFSMKSKSQ
jgi:hypothetical protein